jgi:hypothetical protein
VLQNLGKLSLSVRHRKDGDGAEKIAWRIAAIFDAMTTYGEVKTWDKTAARRLAKLGATAKWEEQFEINSVPQRRAIDKNAKAKRRRIFVQIGHWDLSLTTTTILRKQRECGLCEKEILSILRVEPQYQSSRSALAVFFSEVTDGLSTSTIPPIVLAYNMVSPKQLDKLLSVICSDDANGLLRLLADGEASIRDCDFLGRSLLHVSSHAKKRCQQADKCSTFVSMITPSVARSW